MSQNDFKISDFKISEIIEPQKVSLMRKEIRGSCIPAAADNVSRPLPYRLSADNQPGRNPLDRFSTPRLPLLACI
jgi:hypothetical protein